MAATSNPRSPNQLSFAGNSIFPRRLRNYADDNDSGPLPFAVIRVNRVIHPASIGTHAVLASPYAIFMNGGNSFALIIQQLNDGLRGGSRRAKESSGGKRSDSNTSKRDCRECEDNYPVVMEIIGSGRLRENPAYNEADRSIGRKSNVPTFRFLG